MRFVLERFRSMGRLDMLQTVSNGTSATAAQHEQLSCLEVQLEWQELFQSVLDADGQRQHLTRCDTSAVLQIYHNLLR